jgi:hypothetical protein
MAVSSPNITTPTDFLKNYQQPGLKAFKAVLSKTSLPSTQVAKLLEHLDQKNILFVAYSIAKNSLAPGQEDKLEEKAQNLIPVLQSAVDSAQREVNLTPEEAVNINQTLDEVSRNSQETIQLYQEFGKEYPPDQTERPGNYESSKGGSNPLLDHIQKKASKALEKKIDEIWENFKKSPTGQAVENHLAKISVEEVPGEQVSTSILPTAGTVSITTGEDLVIGAVSGAGVAAVLPKTPPPTSALAIRLGPAPGIPPSGPPPTIEGSISGKIIGFSFKGDLTSIHLPVPKEYIEGGFFKVIPRSSVFETLGINPVEDLNYVSITEKAASFASRFPRIANIFNTVIPASSEVTTLVATPTGTVSLSGISTVGGVTVGTATSSAAGAGAAGAGAAGAGAVAGAGATGAAAWAGAAVGTSAITAAGTGAVAAVGTEAAVTTAGAAAGATAGAAAGAPSGPGAIVTAIIGALISLLAALLPKAKKDIEALAGAVLAIIFSLSAGLGFLPSLAVGAATGGFFAITNISIVSAISGLSSSLVSLAEGAAVGTAVAFFVAAITIPAIVAVILFFISTGGYVTPQAPAAFFDPGGGFADPSGCPLSGGVVSLGSYDPTNEHNRSGGHGSDYYWTSVYGGNCYHIPQASGCFASNPPDSSRCNQPGITPTCSEYGYAADIFSSDTRVILPLVDGQSRDWSCTYGFANGSVGDTVYCNTTSGSPSVHLVLTHVIASPGFSASGPSGTVITGLFDQGGNTHLHLEAQVDGVWARPENYFCGGS